VDAAFEGELAEGGAAAIQEGGVLEHDEIFGKVVSVGVIFRSGIGVLQGWRKAFDDDDDDDDGLCLM
jgi:hypothetical protein